MLSNCGLDCCDECSRREECGGCKKVDGHPFGGSCIAAECIKRGGIEEFMRLKNALISEFNALGIEGLEVSDLSLLNGYFVNFEYQLADGQSVKLLKDNYVYLGNQIERFGSDRCYGIVADDTNMLVCEYGCNGKDPEIVMYKRR